MPPRLNVHITPSFTPCARYRYFGDAESILLSPSMMALPTTQIVSTVAEPTGAGKVAVQIKPSGATTLIGASAPSFHCISKASVGMIAPVTLPKIGRAHV